MSVRKLKQYRYTFADFSKEYPTDQVCAERLAKIRWPNGVVCSKCGGVRCCHLKNGLYECYDCGHQTSVTAGTIMEGTHLPLTKWFLAFFLFSQDKRGISALQLAKQLGTTYKTAWAVLRRIRLAIGMRDAQHMLSGIVEFDDMFVGAPTSGKKRGRGTEKAKAFVALSLDASGKPQYLKMGLTPNIKCKSVRHFAEGNIEHGSVIRSDGYLSYLPALGQNYIHQPKVYVAGSGDLHWLHIAISNAKAFIQGTYHGLSKAHLQEYLDEYCYRFSRRYYGAGLFSRLMVAMAQTVPD